MNSAIYQGSVTHHRLTPRDHKFTYRVFALHLDLGELDQLTKTSWLLGRNRLAPLAFHDKDHGDGGDLSAWLDRLLAEHGLPTGGAKRVLCYPRLFGFVFNPLSTWFCYDVGGLLAAIVYEVHNTFGERHAYVLPVADTNDIIEQECAKDFYVSPFLSNDCSYRFTVRPPGEDVLVAIDEKEAGAPVLTALFAGKRTVLNDWNLASALLRHPLMTVKIVAAIHYEAFRLWLSVCRFMHMEPQRLPRVESRMMEHGSRIPLWGQGMVAAARKLAEGELVLRFANGAERAIRGAQPGVNAVLEFTRARALPRILFGGTAGLAESYFDGDWSSPDLASVIALGAHNERHIAGGVVAALPQRVMQTLKHKLRPNTRSGAKRNIQAHYDLGNAFYREWLDPTMTYSSALFEGAMTLEEAQRNKWRRIAEELDLSPGDHILEIGCGWGGFAIFAAREYGARVTGLTLSQEQHDFAKATVAREGLGNLIDIRLEDYRDVQGTFDRIVSIEMFEAIGEKQWKQYFDVCRERLKPGGIASLQIITIADERFAAYRRNPDFIQLYIFPGGMLPSPSALGESAKSAGLGIETVRTFALSYADTLKEWRERFDAAWPTIAPLGFDERFKRMWDFYLAYCEGGFRAGAVDVGQFKLTRA